VGADAGSSHAPGSSDSDAFDRAARLLRTAGHERITLVDETTAHLLADRYVISSEARGLVLRGPVTEPDHVSASARVTPFVGRDRELSTLQAVFDECERERRARGVTGPPGIGKSRLRRELVAALRQRARRRAAPASSPLRAAPGPRSCR